MCYLNKTILAFKEKKLKIKKALKILILEIYPTRICNSSEIFYIPDIVLYFVLQDIFVKIEPFFTVLANLPYFDESNTTFVFT